MFQTPNKSLLKIGRSGYYGRIMELHRSNHIAEGVAESWSCPESWLPSEALEKPLEYPPSRDIWGMGIILLQMLRGFAVTTQFPDVESVLQSGDNALSHDLNNLLSAIFTSNRKKSPSCTMLTRHLSQITGPIIASSTISIPSKSPGYFEFNHSYP
jgi:translation initiation factor 2-alpha kinase 4